MVCKVYHYENKNGDSLYLNANDSRKINHESVLKMYVNWYNKDYAPFENLPLVNISDYTFVDSFCPIDFYDETTDLVRNKYVICKE